MATNSCILAWRIPVDRGAWQLQSTGSQRVRHDSVTKRAHTVTALADQGRPAGSAAAEGFQAQLSRLPDAVLGGSLGGSPAQSRLHQNPCDRQRTSSAPRRGSAEPRPRGCSGLGEPRPALPSFYRMYAVHLTINMYRIALFFTQFNVI